MKIIICLFVIFQFSNVFSQIAEEYNISGQNKAMQFNYTESIEDFSKAIELRPDFAEAYYFRMYPFRT